MDPRDKFFMIVFGSLSAMIILSIYMMVFVI